MRLVIGSMTVSHTCVMHPRCHGPRGVSRVRSRVVQYHRRSRLRHVFHTWGDGFACRGKRYIGVRGLSVPFKAHSHMCWPLLEHMSAMVVTPRYNRHRCAWTNSMGLMLSRLVMSSMMKLSCRRCGHIHPFGSSRMWLLMLSRNSQVCDT